jgi:hypothetical protein
MLKVFVVRVWFPISGGEVENIGKLFTLNQRWAKWLPADHSIAVKHNFDVPGERYEIFGVKLERPCACRMC